MGVQGHITLVCDRPGCGVQKHVTLEQAFDITKNGTMNVWHCRQCTKLVKEKVDGLEHDMGRHDEHLALTLYNVSGSVRNMVLAELHIIFKGFRDMNWYTDYDFKTATGEEIPFDDADLDSSVFSHKPPSLLKSPKSSASGQ